MGDLDAGPLSAMSHYVAAVSTCLWCLSNCSLHGPGGELVESSFKRVNDSESRALCAKVMYFGRLKWGNRKRWRL